MHFGRLIALFLFVALLDGCTCCAYLNHMFNAERLYEEATELRTARLDSIPDETQSYPGSEESQKYEKIIEKGSRVLERFPNNKKRTAEAVFLIAESYRHKGDWPKAITKYDEYERYFADNDSMRTVEYQRAYCLYRNQEYNISRFALEPVVASKDHPYYFQGLNLLSLLNEKSEIPEQAIAALEALLADKNGTPYMKGKAHFRLAGLYFKMEEWDKAHEHYNAKEIENLNDRERQTAGEQSAECLVNKKEYLKAADEFKALYKVEAYEKQRPTYLVRIGENTLWAGRDADAFVIFNKVNTEYPRSEPSARSYFNMGDFEQTKKLDYELAMSYYDSSYIARSISEYGLKSRERRKALRNLVSMRDRNEEVLEKNKDSIPDMKSFFKTEFMIAELFLLKLSEADSAIARLTNVIEKSDDTASVMRAAYARAFIYDEFLHDPDTAEELYKEIIEKYPNTDYAKQAQTNLGMHVTVKTNEDIARDRYMVAESLWTVASEMPVSKMELVDSAYATAFAAFDSLYREYPHTQSGVQALYMKAVYFQMNPERIDSAVAVYRNLRDNYSQTPWGKRAVYLLNTRSTITDDELARLRTRTAKNIENLERKSKQYYVELNETPEEKKSEIISKEDEILENTYNSMYDFE
ncbi:MAG: tetratricopeptide repeat protein [Fibrobacter sp.]|nr:tetratricopeptide repeat protein [Fibrobacter sp.]